MARRRRITKPSERPTSHEVITFVEKFLRIPDGPNAGQPLILSPWQKQEIVRIYDNPVRRSIISTPKKNGKTGLCAALLLNHLAGRARAIIATRGRFRRRCRGTRRR